MGHACDPVTQWLKVEAGKLLFENIVAHLVYDLQVRSSQASQRKATTLCVDTSVLRHSLFLTLFIGHSFCG